MPCHCNGKNFSPRRRCRSLGRATPSLRSDSGGAQSHPGCRIALPQEDSIPRKGGQYWTRKGGRDWTRFDTLSKDAARFEAEKTRKQLIHDEGFKPDQVVRYFARPFDFQWCYYSGIRPLWNEPRPQLWDWSCIPGNKYLVSRQVRGGNPEGPPFYFLTCIGDDHALRTDAYFFPMRAHDHLGDHRSGALLPKTEITNLSTATRAYLEGLGFTNIDDDSNCYSGPWWHALAIGFSPKYLAEHSEGIAIGWPRIPMPQARHEFDQSAALGRRVADLLNPEVHVTGNLNWDDCRPSQGFRHSLGDEFRCSRMGASRHQGTGQSRQGTDHPALVYGDGTGSHSQRRTSTWNSRVPRT